MGKHACVKANQVEVGGSNSQNILQDRQQRTSN